VAVGLPLLQLAVFSKPLEDPTLGLVLRQTLKLAGVLVHPAVGPDDHRLR
jgi:hypothetical protein